MDKLIKNYRELFRTLNRLNNTNKGLLLKGDLERLETARKILNSQKSNEPRVIRSNENSGLNIADVSNAKRTVCKHKWNRIGGMDRENYRCSKCGVIR